MARSAAIQPEAAERLVDAAQRAIKQYILDHHLRPGDSLPTEGQLAAALGIGRNSVREAVKALEALGALGTRPGVGPFVRPFSFDPILVNLAYSFQEQHDSILDLLEVRRQLEGAFVEVVAATATPDQLRVLRSTVDRMGARAAAGQGFTEEDRFFHQTLYRNLGNALLPRLLGVFWEVYVRLRAGLPGIRPADGVRSWEEHRRILEALEQGDGPGARAAMLASFGAIRDRLREAQQAAPEAPRAAAGGGPDGAARDVQS